MDAGSLGKTCIGQIHTNGQGHCSIIVELEFDNGSIVAHVRDESCNNKQFTVGTADIGNLFSYNITMYGESVQVTTNNGGMPWYAYSWFSGLQQPELYLKAGNYLQSTGSSSSVGGLVMFSELKTFHAK